MVHEILMSALGSNWHFELKGTGLGQGLGGFFGKVLTISIMFILLSFLASGSP